MELVAIIKISDNAYADYDKWNIVSDSPILVEYEENGCLMYLKDLGTELKVKPLPKRKEDVKEVYFFNYDHEQDMVKMNYEYLDEILDNSYKRGYNTCLKEITGETE